jgi:glucose/arabinose dehydrogenase
MKTSVALLVITSSLALTVAAVGQNLPPGNGPAQPNATILEPTPLPFSDALLSRLKTQPGFKISVFARDAGNVRMMAVRPNGDIYVSRRSQGDVLLLRDRDRDGVADGRAVVAQNLKLAHGLALRGNTLYIVADRMVYTASIRADSTLERPKAIITDLPDSGQHSARTVNFGPDGYMYLGVGSTCNSCPETNPENATILRALPDGSARTIFAKGLRHTIGFGWHPTTKVMWGFDQGSDWRGDEQPPEELNRLEQNADYGWPYCFANKKPDEFLNGTPPNTTNPAYCATTRAPALTYTAHAAAIGMTFYTGTQFPAEYRNNAFVAFRGSWNRSQPSGYNLVRVRFDAQGNPTGFEDFVTGWLIPNPNETPVAQGPASTTPEQQQTQRPAQFGRVAGVAVWTDGSLLLSEDQGGVIYRISYTGAR